MLPKMNLPPKTNFTGKERRRTNFSLRTCASRFIHLREISWRWPCWLERGITIYGGELGSQNLQRSLVGFRWLDARALNSKRRPLHIPEYAPQVLLDFHSPKQIPVHSLANTNGELPIYAPLLNPLRSSSIWQHFRITDPCNNIFPSNPRYSIFTNKNKIQDM